MKKIYLYFTAILLLAQVGLYAQNSDTKRDFNYTVKADEGELNQRQLRAKVVVAMDTKAFERPMRLQVFLSQPKSKKWKLVVSSTKIIESMYPAEKKGEHNGSTIPDFFIENGLIQMVTDNDKRKSRYSFRYKDGTFELIYIVRVTWDGKNTTSQTQIDLLAGTKTAFDQQLGSDAILNKREMAVKFKTLPKLQDVSFSDLEKY